MSQGSTADEQPDTSPSREVSHEAATKTTALLCVVLISAVTALRLRQQKIRHAEDE